jgi:hypothetical protein
MGYCTEILRAPAAKSLQEDVGAAKPAFDHCKTIPGHIRYVSLQRYKAIVLLKSHDGSGWGGLQVEDPTTVHFLLSM